MYVATNAAAERNSVDRVRVAHRPRLPSDNEPYCVSEELVDYLETHQIAHTHGALYHPMVQDMIEHHYRSMKNKEMVPAQGLEPRT